MWYGRRHSWILVTSRIIGRYIHVNIHIIRVVIVILICQCTLGNRLLLVFSFELRHTFLFSGSGIDRPLQLQRRQCRMAQLMRQWIRCRKMNQWCRRCPSCGCRCPIRIRPSDRYDGLDLFHRPGDGTHSYMMTAIVDTMLRIVFFQ